MSDREEVLKRLNDVHSFPGNYVFKVIGANNDEFVSKIIQACINVLGPDSNPDVSLRESSGKKHVSVTVSVEVDDAETVLAVYDVLGNVEEIKFIL